MQNGGTGPPFCENFFPARRKIRLWRILAGLEGTTVVHFAFRQSSATFFPSQKHDVFLIHPFPPVALLTAKPRSCKTAAHVRRFAKTKFYFRPDAKFAKGEFWPDLAVSPPGHTPTLTNRNIDLFILREIYVDMRGFASLDMWACAHSICKVPLRSLCSICAASRHVVDGPHN